MASLDGLCHGQNPDVQDGHRVVHRCGHLDVVLVVRMNDVAFRHCLHSVDHRDRQTTAWVRHFFRLRSVEDGHFRVYPHVGHDHHCADRRDRQTAARALHFFRLMGAEDDRFRVHPHEGRDFHCADHHGRRMAVSGLHFFRLRGAEDGCLREHPRVDRVLIVQHWASAVRRRPGVVVGPKFSSVGGLRRWWGVSGRGLGVRLSGNGRSCAYS